MHKSTFVAWNLLLARSNQTLSSSPTRVSSCMRARDRRQHKHTRFQLICPLLCHHFPDAKPSYTLSSLWVWGGGGEIQAPSHSALRFTHILPPGAAFAFLIFFHRRRKGGQRCNYSKVQAVRMTKKNWSPKKKLLSSCRIFVMLRHFACDSLPFMLTVLNRDQLMLMKDGVKDVLVTTCYERSDGILQHLLLVHAGCVYRTLSYHCIAFQIRICKTKS